MHGTLPSPGGVAKDLRGRIAPPPLTAGRAPAPFVSELLSAQRLDFCAADLTEIAKKVDRPTFDEDRKRILPIFA